jgi:hypothetical protein
MEEITVKCWQLGKECKYRDEENWCHWDCEEDSPPSNCNLANEGWGCPWTCYYEAKENGCEDVDKYSFDWRTIKY